MVEAWVTAIASGGAGTNGQFEVKRRKHGGKGLQCGIPVLRQRILECLPTEACLAGDFTHSL